MTVGELIKKLQETDPESKVVVSNETIGVLDADVRILSADDIEYEQIEYDYPSIKPGDVAVYFE